MLVFLFAAGSARAEEQQAPQPPPPQQQQQQGKPLHRIKQHEQDLEKKVKTERDRPNKKARAKEVDKHVEDNIRQLGREIEGAVNESGVPKGQPPKASKSSGEPALKR